MAYRILIVDDDIELLKMLKNYFEIKRYDVMMAEDGTDALEKIHKKPDIILLDINMPKIDGLEVCRRIRGKVTCPIIFLTAKVEEQDRVNGLLSGGDDYILKPFSLKELDARIIAHLKREERHKGKSEYRFHGDLSIDYGAKRVQIGENDLELTKLEYTNIEFLSMNPGQVFDRERIYEKVCGYDAEGDSRVVTELIRRVRKKLAEYTQTEYIETVWGMRGQLEENNRRLWQMIEDERVLRAAIAHDIRSPLAIMRGYQEMLLEFVPEDMLDQEKMMEMLRGGMLQIERMNHFIDSMRKMTKLEERELNCSVVDIRQLINQIEALAEVVVEKSEKNFTVTTVRESEILTADEEIIMEVADNLLANAFRYANQEVRLKLTVTPQYLKMSIRDDGIGFQENIDRVTQAFYHENPQDDLKHFGMGMYISRIYCERHGGKLLIKNVADGGAEVEAVFKNYVLEEQQQK